MPVLGSGMTHQQDVLIVGGGHNSLVCGYMLAKSGHSVRILEKNAVVGGAAVTEEFYPGFRNSVASYTVSLLNPGIVKEMDLKRHGLRIVERPAANFWPIDDRRSLLLPYGDEARRQAIAAFSKSDAAALGRFNADLEIAANVLRGLTRKTPPNAGRGLREVLRGAWMSRDLLKLTAAQKRLVGDLFTRSAADFLGQYFESDIVKAAFAFDGIVGAYASPYTPGTAYVLLHHCFGEVNGKTGVWGHAIGGMGAITHAMAEAAMEAGVAIETEAPVARIVVENDRAVGVERACGAVERARVVAAGVPPKLLFRDLIGSGDVDDEVHKRFLAIRSGSGTFRMNVALSELPDFRARPGKTAADHHGAGIIIGSSLDYLDRAYLDARRDGWSGEPVVEMVIPSTLDASLAPEGRHVASLFVQHVAPHLPDGRSWDDAAEVEAFADLVIETVTGHAPNFKGAVLGRQALSPLELERRFGLIDGDIFHGQLSLDQLFSLRPVTGYANYRLPVAGLYLCGSGAHPGGGVTGLPGHNAAREIAKDLR
jgi:phytoene dehydrogenase-like protein